MISRLLLLQSARRFRWSSGTCVAGSSIDLLEIIVFHEKYTESRDITWSGCCLNCRFWTEQMPRQSWPSLPLRHSVDKDEATRRSTACGDQLSLSHDLTAAAAPVSTLKDSQKLEPQLSFAFTEDWQPLLYAFPGRQHWVKIEEILSQILLLIIIDWNELFVFIFPVTPLELFVLATASQGACPHWAVGTTILRFNRLADLTWWY